MRVTIIGAGKVGRSLARALGGTKHIVTLRPARRGVPRDPVAAALLVLAVRDGQVTPWAHDLARAGVVGRRTAVVHVAGALGPAALVPLKASAAGVAQAHPAVSFPSSRAVPELRGATLLLAGDTMAVKRAATMARAIGMVPRHAAVEPVSYHAACALAANGSAALAAAACRLLEAAGVAADEAPRLVGPLLRTVGENVTRLGFPEALSGPVRRGDAATLRRHLSRLHQRTPDLVPLYVELVRAQLGMARALGEASPQGYDEVEALLRRRT